MSSFLVAAPAVNQSIKGPHKATHGQVEAASQHNHRGQQPLRRKVPQAWGARNESRQHLACATHSCSTPFYSGVHRKLLGDTPCWRVGFPRVLFPPLWCFPPGVWGLCPLRSSDDAFSMMMSPHAEPTSGCSAPDSGWQSAAARPGTTLSVPAPGRPPGHRHTSSSPSAGASSVAAF